MRAALRLTNRSPPEVVRRLLTMMQLACSNTEISNNAAVATASDSLQTFGPAPTLACSEMQST